MPTSISAKNVHQYRAECIFSFGIAEIACIKANWDNVPKEIKKSNKKTWRAIKKIFSKTKTKEQKIAAKAITSVTPNAISLYFIIAGSGFWIFWEYEAAIKDAIDRYQKSLDPKDLVYLLEASLPSKIYVIVGAEFALFTTATLSIYALYDTREDIMKVVELIQDSL